MKLSKYSMGVGDRFGHQGIAQLHGIAKAKAHGLEITPVWNKSYREHSIIKTGPKDTRREADEAVKALDWQGPYLVDADHVNLKIIDPFIPVSDFFTLDVADFIGERAEDDSIKSFVTNLHTYIGTMEIPGIDEAFEINEELIQAIAEKYLFAVQKAGRIYRHIVDQKGAENFVTEISMDETNEPQTPVELFFILAAIAQEGIPAQTIAPKFTGRFNKGVDYVGDVEQFRKEFEQDLAVIRLAVNEFTLPDNLKLSVHSGSDKFSIYGPIHQAITKFDAGLHLKTAGTTWLEELIGLAEAGGQGLRIARQVYRSAYERYDELAKPYASVIDINETDLPTPEEVDLWDGTLYANTLRHDAKNPEYNLSFRQLLHVGYKVAAEMGDQYLDALKAYDISIAVNVTQNIFERHVKPIFLGK